MSEHQRGSAMVPAGAAVIASTDTADAVESASGRFKALAIVHIEVNGVDHQLQLQPRVTLIPLGHVEDVDANRLLFDPCLTRTGSRLRDGLDL